MTVKRPAVVLDRDGTIIRDADYLSDPAGVELLPGAAGAIRTLRAAGFAVVVLSNQSGVARGYFTEAQMRAVHLRLEELLRAEDAALDAAYYCPHYPQGPAGVHVRACSCRKPAPGLLDQAARDLHLDLTASWMVGDKRSDIDCGRARGLRTVLVLTGYGEQTRAAGFAEGAPDRIEPDLAAAAHVILRDAGKAPAA